MKLLGVVLASMVLVTAMLTIYSSASPIPKPKGSLIIENETYYLNASMEIYGDFIVKNSTVVSNISDVHITVYGNAYFYNSSFGTFGEIFSIRVFGNLSAIKSHFENLGSGLGYYEGVRVENGTVYLNENTFKYCFRGIAVYNSSIQVYNSQFTKCKIGLSTKDSNLYMENCTFNGVSLSGVGLRILNSSANIKNTTLVSQSTSIISWRSNVYIENSSLLNNGNGAIILEGNLTAYNSTLGYNFWSNVEFGRESTGKLFNCNIHTSIAGIYVVNSAVLINNTNIYNLGVGVFTSEGAYVNLQNSSLIGCGVTVDSYGSFYGNNIYAMPFIARGNYSVSTFLNSPPTYIPMDEYDNTTISGNWVVKNITILRNSSIVGANVNFQSINGGNVIIMRGNSSVENSTFDGNLYTIHLSDGGSIRNVYLSSQLGIVLHGDVTVENLTTDDGLLRGIIGLLGVDANHTIIKNSTLRGNALGLLGIDSSYTIIRNLSLYNNAFNTLFYNSKNISVLDSEFYYSFLGIAAYKVENITIENSNVKNCISYISMQYSNYSVKNTSMLWNADLGIINSFVHDVYINETVGIISEYSNGYIENSSFIGLEKGITSYFSPQLTVEKGYFDNCMVGIKSNSLAKINNSTFVAVGICASGSVEVNNSYFFIPDRDPSYLFINGANLRNISSSPPVPPNIIQLSGNVSGVYNKTVIITNESMVENAKFYRGVVIYDKAKISGEIRGKNYLIVVPKSANVDISNASLYNQKGVIIHSNTTTIKNVYTKGQFDFFLYNIQNLTIENISSESKLSVYAYKSNIIIANSTFSSYHTCIADSSVINVVSSDYTWTYFRNGGTVYHSHWLKVNVLDSSGNHIESDVILKYDGSNHTYHAATGKIRLPAPYSKRSIWWEDPINISVTATNPYYNYSWIPLYMNSDKEITLIPEGVPELLNIYIAFAAAILLLSLRSKKCLILLLIIPPLIATGAYGKYLEKRNIQSNIPNLDIKEGDILLMGMGWLTPGAFSHTAVFHIKSPDDQWVLFESNEEGAHGSYFSKFLNENHLVALRVKGLCPISLSRVLASMRARVGFSYDPVWVIRSFSAERQYCSGYAYLSFNVVGIDLDPLKGVWGWCYGLGVAPTSLLLSEQVDIVWWL